MPTGRFRSLTNALISPPETDTRLGSYRPLHGKTLSLAQLNGEKNAFKHKANLGSSSSYFSGCARRECPGKTDEALGILRSTLIPAYEATGIHPTVIEDLLGTKDVILIVPLKNGPEYYKYEVPPQDAAAFKALIKNAGSPDKAEEQLDKFIGYLVRQSQKLVFVNDRE